MSKHNEGRLQPPAPVVSAKDEATPIPTNGMGVDDILKLATQWEGQDSAVATALKQIAETKQKAMALEEKQVGFKKAMAEVITLIPSDWEGIGVYNVFITRERVDDKFTGKLTFEVNHATRVSGTGRPITRKASTRQGVRVGKGVDVATFQTYASCNEACDKLGLERKGDSGRRVLLRAGYNVIDLANQGG